jgi:hypothetical protein
VTLPEQSQSDREISYRIGWKKGKIHVSDQTSREAGQTFPAHNTPHPDTNDIHNQNPLLGVIWKRAPYPGWKAVFWTAAVLPAAGFAAVVWLVSRLTEG